MFRDMRRFKQLLSKEEVERILNEGKTGILGVIGDDGYPYTVPVNYVYYNSKIYFHCASCGHKYDSILKNPKVSFCVIDQDEINEPKLATDYKSVILFGKAHFMEKDEACHQALEAFGYKYVSNKQAVLDDIKNEWDNVTCVEIEIEHMTGKRGLFVEK